MPLILKYEDVLINAVFIVKVGLISKPTNTSLLAAATKVLVKFTPLAIALAAVTELFTNNCEVGVKANVGEDVIELVPLK